jgi:hypothetical protein
MLTQHLNRKSVFISLSLLAFSAQAQESEKKFEVYGFVQTDYIQDFKRVNPAWDATLRPSKIPTESGQFGSDGQAVISARQSRFGVKGDLPIATGKLSTKFEFDLFGVGADEGLTTIRLRHAYGQYGNWLAGQTHSLFMDIDVWPNIIDYWGPSGMAFFRNPQIRYTFPQTNNKFSIAIEHATEDIDPGQLRKVGESFGANIQADEKLPDLTAQYRNDGDWGHMQVAGILRRIGYETIGTTTNEPKGHTTGWGLDVSSSIKTVGEDKFLFSVIYGAGIASYMNDGGTDLAPKGTAGDARAKAVPLLGLYAYYDHYWSEKYSTTFGYSSTQVENTSLQEDSAFNKGQYASANLLYKPVKNILVGGELLWGSRTDKDDAYENDVRSQISFKYDFSSLDFI